MVAKEDTVNPLKEKQATINANFVTYNCISC